MVGRAEQSREFGARCEPQIEDLGIRTVVEFPAGQANFSGEMAAELAILNEAGIIRILDLMDDSTEAWLLVTNLLASSGDPAQADDVLQQLLTTDDPPFDAIRERIEDGEAYAALHHDAELMKTYGVLGSPTYVFNEGRQLLYGNVGYRIIDANLRELLSTPTGNGQPSWC